MRLYFTTTPQGKTQRPSLLSLVHVRLPPGYCPSNAASKPGPTVHQGFYRRGCLLLASSQADDRDMVWLVDPDLYPFQSNLVEASVTYPLNGKGCGESYGFLTSLSLSPSLLKVGHGAWLSLSNRVSWKPFSPSLRSHQLSYHSTLIPQEDSSYSLLM